MITGTTKSGAVTVAAAIVLTHVEFPSRYFDLINERHGVILVVAARNVLLLVALGLLLAALRRPLPRPARSSLLAAPGST